MLVTCFLHALWLFIFTCRTLVQTLTIDRCGVKHLFFWVIVWVVNTNAWLKYKIVTTQILLINAILEF
jgi:hypothetical protein